MKNKNLKNQIDESFPKSFIYYLFNIPHTYISRSARKPNFFLTDLHKSYNIYYVTNFHRKIILSLHSTYLFAILVVTYFLVIISIATAINHRRKNDIKTNDNCIRTSSISINQQNTKLSFLASSFHRRDAMILFCEMILP